LTAAEIGLTQANTRPELRSLRESIALARSNSARKPETEIAAYQEHREIFEAIKAGDQRRARTAVRRALDGSLRRLSDSGQIQAISGARSRNRSAP
jgi:DNA-binding FadR family transcriptional regulator